MYNERENIINDLKNENKFLKNELNNFKNNSNPKYIKFSQEITNDSYSRSSLDNTFSVFKSIDNVFHQRGMSLIPGIVDLYEIR